MVEAYKLFWQNFFKLKGRSRRRDFWWPFFINIIVEIVVSSSTNFLTNFIVHGDIVFSFIYGAISLILSIGTFTLSVRRFHDIGMTKKFPVFYLILTLLPYLIHVIDPIIDYTHLDHNHVFVTILSGLIIAYFIVAFITALIALAYCVADSENGSNKYGPNPKPIYE